MNKCIKPPEAGKILYKNLFSHKCHKTTLNLLSEGLKAVTENATALLEEAKILADKERYARADFIATTAQEEIAKSYIIFDMCRLDFIKDERFLQQLCYAFYSHIKKHAYYKIAYDSHNRDYYDMKQVRGIFSNELVRWWPSGDMESGEPDMPNDVYFKREFNLYVDFSDYDQCWILPKRDEQKFKFTDFSSDPISECWCILQKLLDTCGIGLYKSDALNILNNIFRKQHISEQTSNEELSKLYDLIAGEVEHSLNIPKDKFQNSALIGWPLYSFLM